MQTPESRKSTETMPPAPLVKPEEQMSWWERMSSGVSLFKKETTAAVEEAKKFGPKLGLPTEIIEEATSDMVAKITELEKKWKMWKTK